MKRKQFIEKVEEIRTKYNEICRDVVNNILTREEFSMQCDLLYSYFWQLDDQLPDREYKKLGLTYKHSIELFLKTIVQYGTDNIKKDWEGRKDDYAATGQTNQK